MIDEGRLSKGVFWRRKEEKVEREEDVPLITRVPLEVKEIKGEDMASVE